MGIQHKELAAGRWSNLSFAEQMANIGSEVERAINWKNKNNNCYSLLAFERALELLDLTIKDGKQNDHLNELMRLKEELADYFVSGNIHCTTPESWHNFFYPYSLAARMDH